MLLAQVAFLRGPERLEALLVLRMRSLDVRGNDICGKLALQARHERV